MRKRSKYRSKGVILDVMNHVLSGMKIVGQIGPGTTLKIKNHDALNRIRLGQGTHQQPAESDPVRIRHLSQDETNPRAEPFGGLSDLVQQRGAPDN